MCPSLDDALANSSTGSSRLFHYQPMTKTLDFDKLPKVTKTSQKSLYTEHVIKALISE